MHRNDDDIIALRSMHNPQNAGTIFLDRLNRLIGSRAVRAAWIGLDPIRRADRCLDPVDSDVAYADRFLRVLGQADHPSLAVVLGDFWIEELAAQRFQAFGRALLIGAHQPRVPRHIGGSPRPLWHPHPHKKAAPDGEIRSRVTIGRIARPITRFGGQTCKAKPYAYNMGAD